MKIKEMVNLIETKNTDVSFYLTFKKARRLMVAIIKHFDNVVIESCNIESVKWDGYDGCFLVDYSPKDNCMFVQKAEYSDKRIAKSGFADVVIQKKVLKGRKPTDFVLDESGVEVTLI